MIYSSYVLSCQLNTWFMLSMVLLLQWTNIRRRKCVFVFIRFVNKISIYDGCGVYDIIVFCRRRVMSQIHKIIYECIHESRMRQRMCSERSAINFNALQKPTQTHTYIQTHKHTNTLHWYSFQQSIRVIQTGNFQCISPTLLYPVHVCIFFLPISNIPCHIQSMNTKKLVSSLWIVIDIEPEWVGINEGTHAMSFQLKNTRSRNEMVNSRIRTTAKRPFF